MDGREKLWVERAMDGEIEWRSIPESMFDGRKYQFPHCDARVLHLPDKCVYCAKFLALQEERERIGVSNTGETNRQYPCPADHARGQAELVVWKRGEDAVRPRPGGRDVEGFPGLAPRRRRRMKKTFRNPDGTEDVVEGTPEEIAAYERARQQKPQHEGRRKPGVLKGISREELEGLARELRAEMDRRLAELQLQLQPQSPYWYRWITTTAGSNTVVPCRVCGRTDCMENHIWCSSDSSYFTAAKLDS